MPCGECPSSSWPSGNWRKSGEALTARSSGLCCWRTFRGCCCCTSPPSPNPLAWLSFSSVDSGKFPQSEIDDIWQLDNIQWPRRAKYTHCENVWWLGNWGKISMKCYCKSQTQTKLINQRNEDNYYDSIGLIAWWQKQGVLNYSFSFPDWFLNGGNQTVERN